MIDVEIFKKYVPASVYDPKEKLKLEINKRRRELERVNLRQAYEELVRSFDDYNHRVALKLRNFDRRTNNYKKMHKEPMKRRAL